MVTTDADCTSTGVASQKANCGTEYECKFGYSGVPTETELVIETSGDVWAPNYEYGVVLRSTEAKAGVVTRDVLAIAVDDYAVIAQASLGHPVTPGHGMVIGEVHDCGDVRLSNAMVNVDVAAKLLVYFTADEAQPLPDQSATSTSVLGLFAAVDVPEGSASVAAVGLSGGATTALGFDRIRVFPDAITTLRFRGPLPVAP